MQTYTLILNSMEANSIQATLSGLPENKIEKAMEMAKLAFRSVEVTDDLTGEVIFTFYKDSKFFYPVYSHGEMLNILCGYYGVE